MRRTAGVSRLVLPSPRTHTTSRLSPAVRQETPLPTYDYQCEACGHKFEELQSFSAPVLTKCPKCKKNKLERLFGGGGAIIFKGSGFYETDYRRVPDKPAGDAPAESKPETKTDATPAAPAADSSPKPAVPAPKAESKGGAKKKD